MNEGSSSGRARFGSVERVGAPPERALGEYELLAELARGGMGRVYLARRAGHGGFERYFAIKMMLQHVEDDREGALMLLDEANIASRLHHPNVVPVLDIGASEDGYYLVMEYVEGCSLQDLMRRSKRERPAACVAAILLDALHGLHAVHTLSDAEGRPYGVVHRDVSPHNLLVGIDGTCRVTDFGIAKAAERFTDTQLGVHKGKLPFMAPEQLQGASDLDARVDVWAAGVTLYTALTGVHPFRGSSDASTVHDILAKELAPPSTVGLRPPACFDAIVTQALSRDREQRHRSALEFADALREVAIREGMLASPSQVAAWVERVFGAKLDERRRRIRGMPAGELPSPQTVSRSVPALPRLWTKVDGGSDGGSSSGNALVEEPVVEEPPPPERRASSRAMWLVAIASGAAFGIAALYGTSRTLEAPAMAAAPAAPSEAPPAAPAPREEAPPTPPSVTSDTTAADPVEPVLDDARGTERAEASPRRPPRWRARRAPVPEPPVAEPAPSAPPEPPPPTLVTAPPAPARALERNPYLRGE